MKNYFEHEIDVKFYDNFLSNSKEWDWFINEIESEFKGFSSKINNWQDFSYSLGEISSVYDRLIKINSIDGVNLKITKSWLVQLYYCVQLYNSQKNIEEIWGFLDNDFSKLFAIVIYVTKIVNAQNGSNYLFYTPIFTQHNIYKLFNFDDVFTNYDIIINHLSLINLIDKDSLIDCFDSNVNKIDHPANNEIIEKYKNNLLSANCFNYQRLFAPNGESWEIQYLFDMLKISIKENEIVPFSIFNGISTPNISLWTNKILNDLIEYFNNDTASYIIESIRYLLYGICPSKNTINLHFDLLNEYLSSKDALDSFQNLNCSSLVIINKLIYEKKLTAEIKKKHMSNFLSIIHKYQSPDTIMELSKIHCILSEEQKTIVESYKKQLVNTITDVKTMTDFTDYCRKDSVQLGMDNETLAKVADIFNTLIYKENNSVSMSHLFYEFMLFLINLQKNVNVDKNQVKRIMIELQQLWENKFYDKCVSSMQTISHSFNVTEKEINTNNQLFLSSSSFIPRLCMPLKDKDILHMMEQSSENVLFSLCSHISISKTFPKREELKIEKHDIELSFIKIIDRIKQEKGYKLLNHLESDVMLADIYRTFAEYTQLYMSLFHKDLDLYNKVKLKFNNEFNLIDYDGINLYPAHLIQLFPILENKIREFGIHVSIVPFKETIDEFLHMKDASSVLQKILMEVFSETNSFEGAQDFFFIYQTMYNGNLLNVRNEACHGRDYLTGNRLKFAFKVTLFCLDLIMERINYIKSN